MKFLSLAFLATIACNPYRQTGFGNDSDDTDTDAADTDAADTDAPAEEEEEEDTEDEDNDDTGGPNPTPASDCHPFDPVGTAGWSRTYAIDYVDDLGAPASGVETQAGNGGAVLVPGSFEVSSSLSGGTTPRDMYLYVSCDGGKNAFLNGIAVSGLDPTSGSSTLLSMVPAHQYLPTPAQMSGSGTTWSVESDLQQPSLLPIPGFPPSSAALTSADYVALGLQDEPITVTAGTFTVSKITVTFTQTVSGLSGSTTVNAYSEFYYAEGIGLVKEITKNTDTDQVIIDKELTAYTGLEPAE